MKTAFASELAAAATTRRVDLVGAGGEARYRVRGYVSTQTNPQGEPVLTFVWDVFDAESVGRSASQGRARCAPPPADRPSAAPPTLGRVSTRRPSQLASKSMDEIAAFLSEAKAGVTLVAADTASGRPWGSHPGNPIWRTAVFRAIQVCAGIVTVSYHC